MKRSTDRIAAAHAGSLSRPANLIAMGRARVARESADAIASPHVLAAAGRKQRELGIDIVVLYGSSGRSDKE
jgi:hypothetical protein